MPDSLGYLYFFFFQALISGTSQLVKLHLFGLRVSCSSATRSLKLFSWFPDLARSKRTCHAKIIAPEELLF